MFRIDTPSAVSALPDPAAVGTPGYFGRGNLATGQAPTTLSADWANMVQEEIMSVVLDAGLSPNKTDHAQLLAALDIKLSNYVLASALGHVKAAGELAPASGTVTRGYNVASVTFSGALIVVAYTAAITNPVPVVMGGDASNGSSSQSAFWGAGSSNAGAGFSVNFGVSGGGGSITKCTFVTVGI